MEAAAPVAQLVWEVPQCRRRAFGLPEPTYRRQRPGLLESIALLADFRAEQLCVQTRPQLQRQLRAKRRAPRATFHLNLTPLSAQFYSRARDLFGDPLPTPPAQWRDRIRLQPSAGTREPD